MTEESDLRKTAGSLYVALGEQTNGMYALLQAVTPPNGGPPPHIHEHEDEGFYVLEGTFRVWVGDNEPVELNVGDHAFGPRKIQHYFRNVGSTPGRLLILITPAGFENYFKELEAVRADGGDNLLEKEEAIDEKYGIQINRRA